MALLLFGCLQPQQAAVAASVSVNGSGSATLGAFGNAAANASGANLGNASVNAAPAVPSPVPFTVTYSLRGPKQLSAGVYRHYLTVKPVDLNATPVRYEYAFRDIPMDASFTNQEAICKVRQLYDGALIATSEVHPGQSVATLYVLEVAYPKRVKVVDLEFSCTVPNNSYVHSQTIRILLGYLSTDGKPLG